MTSEASGPGDRFDDIVAHLKDDPSFQVTVAGALHEAQEPKAVSEHQDNRLDLVQPAYSVSLNDIAVFLYDRFHELCEMQGLDVHSPDARFSEFQHVAETINNELSSMSELLVRGDVVWASNTYGTSILTPSMEEGGTQPIPIDDAVVGYFLKPIIMPIADDAHNLLASLGDDSKPPVGIGLVLESAAYIDWMGDVHSELFESGVVVIPLGGAGLDLRLLYLQQGD
ncbi:MAG: hypothetical protein WBP22_01320 [Candidatus Saccharimonas sp.]